MHDFEPTFVYPIFGQEESIFGYSQDLQVDVRPPPRLSPVLAADGGSAPLRERELEAAPSGLLL